MVTKPTKNLTYKPLLLKRSQFTETDKGVLIEEDTFRKVILPWFRPPVENDPSWSNNVTFKELLKKHKITQAQAAEIVGMSVFTVMAWCKSQHARSSAHVTDSNLQKLKDWIKENG